MKTSRTRRVTVCFETCIVVTGNIQWEVTLACSALRAPYAVRSNPKTQPLYRDYWQARKQIDQRDSALETSHVSFDHYYCADMLIFFSCMFKDFSLIVSVHSIRYEFIPNVPECYADHVLQLKATHANISNTSE